MEKFYKLRFCLVLRDISSIKMNNEIKIIMKKSPHFLPYPTLELEGIQDKKIL